MGSFVGLVGASVGATVIRVGALVGVSVGESVGAAVRMHRFERSFVACTLPNGTDASRTKPSRHSHTHSFSTLTAVVDKVSQPCEPSSHG